MTMKYSVTLRSNQATEIENSVGASPKIRFYTGSPPADCAAAPTGTLLCELSLPVDWLANGANGAVTMTGTWPPAACSADGTPGYFRLYNSGGGICHIQGTVTITGGGGDMTVDNTSWLTGQNVQVTGWTITVNNT